MFAVTSRSRGLALRTDGGEVASTKEQRCECLSRFFLMSYSGATPGVTQTDTQETNTGSSEAIKDAVKQTRLLSPQRVARSHPLLAEQEITPWGHSRLEAPMGQKTGKVRRGENYHWWNRKSLEPWDVQRNHFFMWQKYVFPLVIGRSSQQQGVFCRWTRWTLVLWRSELSGLISCRGLYSSVWPCCHFIPFLFTGGFKYGVAVFAEVNRLKYSNTPLFEYLNGTETDTVQFCESVALWECWCKITVVTASHVLVSALIFSLSSSVSPVCLFVADIR